MTNRRYKTEAPARYTVPSVDQSLANDSFRRALEAINGGPFVDGVMIDGVAVQGNIPVNVFHNLGRPPKFVTVVRVDNDINQITVRFDQSHYAAGVNKSAQMVIRPSATGVITLWVS